ncbi:MAG: LL-diaminopimelate aminotransferase [Candidatus Omnitrophota bacterium]
MGIKIKISDRLKRLPPYLFVEIDKQKKKKIKEGRDIIDLGIGDPDQPTPDFIITAFNEAMKDPANHRYPSNAGLSELRAAIAGWYRGRFNVKLDPDREVLPLIGSKEGIAHAPLAFINPGDSVLVPNPCYPPYKGGTIFAGGEPVLMPLLQNNGFLPDLSAIPASAAKRAGMMFLNYPNNPTSAAADKSFFKRAVEFAVKNNILICHDAAYSEVYYDGARPASFLEVEGAKEAGIEFHSLSKTFNMTGWRIGFACGNSEAIAALGKVKSNIDSGIFRAIQRAGIEALKNGDNFSNSMREVYQKRRDVLIDGLNSIGWKAAKPEATFYVWLNTPNGSDSISVAKRLLDEADIVATPGVGFGPSGEGFVRVALTVPETRLKEAVERIKKVL